MKKICLTGGGTGGHITPLLAIYKELGKDYEFFWIGENDSLEKKICSENNILFYPIQAGKLRRYFSLKTLLEPFRILSGIGKSYLILKKQKPDLIISKGGHVSLPVAIAAKFLGIKLFLHESDTIPGLANRWVGKFASRVYLGFEKAGEFFDKNKVKVVGQILSPELIGIENIKYKIENESILINNETIQEKENSSSVIPQNSFRHSRGKRSNPEIDCHSELVSESNNNPENTVNIDTDPVCGTVGQNSLSPKTKNLVTLEENEAIQKPYLMDHHEVLQTSRDNEPKTKNQKPKTNLLIIAGSQGSSRIFLEILKIIDDLLDFEITVILGTLNLKYKQNFEKYSNVKVLEFVNAQKMGEILANTDIAITRAGATSLAELEYFGAKMIIIPLTESANNHQFFNARFFEGKGEIMIEEKNLSDLKNEVLKLSGYKKQNFKNKGNLALEVIREDIDSL